MCYIEEKIVDLALDTKMKCYIEEKIVDLAVYYEK